jgi:hypothetical protein
MIRFIDPWRPDYSSLETLDNEHTVTDRNILEERFSQNDISYNHIQCNNYFTSILPRFVPRNAKLNTKTPTVVSIACDPRYSDFTVVNEYFDKLLHTAYWLKPYRAVLRLNLLRFWIDELYRSLYKMHNCITHSCTKNGEEAIHSGGAN